MKKYILIAVYFLSAVKLQIILKRKEIKNDEKIFHQDLMNFGNKIKLLIA